MTTSTAILRLRACPRCLVGALTLCDDIYGRFWDCLQCGYISHADIPPRVSIRRAEEMKAYYSFFDYAGSTKAFIGYRLRGRLLPPDQNEMSARFNLGCPYVNCSRRQLAEKAEQYGSKKVYQCSNRHRIYLRLDELTWA